MLPLAVRTANAPARHERELRQDECLATIVAIRDDATDQAEQEERHESHQPEQSKLKRVPRELEHLPGNRDALDLGASLRKDLRAPDEAEIAVVQHSEGALVTRRRLGGRLASAHGRRLCHPREDPPLPDDGIWRDRLGFGC